MGLPGLDGADYLHQDNPLGIAWSALMRWPRPQRTRAAVKALDRIVAGTDSPARKMLLCECVQAYAPLEDDQRVELYSLLQEPQNQGVRAMVKTWSEEGEERGKEQGKRDLVLKQLKARFPDLSSTAQQRVKDWPVEKVEEVGIALLTAQSLRDLGLDN